MQNRILLLIAYLLFPVLLSAQNKWVTKGNLYSDNYLTVDIQYLVSPDGCGPDGRPSYFRYHIKRISAKRNYYINWRFDFFNCQNELKTQLNSLHIVKESKVGFYAPERNSFLAKRMSNYANAIKKSDDLPEVGNYKPVSTISMEPLALSGNKSLTVGESTTLTLVGGSLGTGAKWVWHEDNCDGRVIGQGTTLTFSPVRTVNVFVRAEGQQMSPCTSTEINVKQTSLAPTAITGKQNICEGEKDIILSVSGGRLFGPAKWVWYSGSCFGEKLGEGPSITVSPTRTTSYFLRAEDGDQLTACASMELTVNLKSVSASGIEGVSMVPYGGQTSVKLTGGYLAPGAKWVWYTGKAGNLQYAGSGSTLNTGVLFTSEVFSVRAEGDCYQSEVISKAITVPGKPAVASASSTNRGKKPTFSINAGVNFNETSEIGKNSNYLATVGYGGRLGGYVRAKFTAKNTKASFQTLDSRIIDYNTPGYYEYDAKTISTRSGYTAGLFFGGYTISGYIGGGYGERQLLWGLNQYSYQNATYSGSSFAKNTARSFKGAEVEAGLMLRLGLFSLMGGVSSLEFKYTDFNIGAGLNF